MNFNNPFSFWTTESEKAAYAKSIAAEGDLIWKVYTSYGGSCLFVTAPTQAEALTAARAKYNTSEYCYVESVRRATASEIEYDFPRCN